LIWREVWRILVMSLVSVGETRDRFSELVADVERTHERVVVTRHGRPVAIMIAPADLETLDILSDPHGACRDPGVG
jgi:antitoxin YefM